jgi:hypothetical protein
MATPHEQSVEAANAANAALLDVFAALSVDSAIYNAYSLAIQSLQDRLDDIAYVRLVLNRLVSDVMTEAESLLVTAGNIGATQAQASAAAWGLSRVVVNVRSALVFGLAYDAIQSLMDSQSIQTRALIANGGVMPETLLGSDTQIGLLSPGVVSRELARWTVATASAINEEGVTQALAANNQPPSEWGMQVVAAIDNRTTETCLGAHAQVQPLGMPFELHGDPWESAKNYGFSNMQSPNHWCRTKSCTATGANTRHRLYRGDVNDVWYPHRPTRR